MSFISFSFRSFATKLSIYFIAKRKGYCWLCLIVYRGGFRYFFFFFFFFFLFIVHHIYLFSYFTLYQLQLCETSVVPLLIFYIVKNLCYFSIEVTSRDRLSDFSPHFSFFILSIWFCFSG